MHSDPPRLPLKRFNPLISEPRFEMTPEFCSCSERGFKISPKNRNLTEIAWENEIDGNLLGRRVNIEKLNVIRLIKPCRNPTACNEIQLRRSKEIQINVFPNLQEKYLNAPKNAKNLLISHGFLAFLKGTMKLKRLREQDRFPEGQILQVPTWFSCLSAGCRRCAEQ